MTPAETKYMRIVNAIKAQVREGSLQPSGRVPSEGELMEAFRVSSITVRKAMAVLAAEGLVFRVKGKGTFVAGPPAKIAPKKIYLIFDVDDLDVSLNKIVRGIHTYLTGKDFLLILKNESFCGTFLETEGDLGQAGLIVYLHPEGGKPAALYRLYQAGAHFVCIDRHLGQYPVNYVGTNNHDAEYHAVAHLLALGHEGVAFLAGNFALSSEGERYAGYRDALLDNGLAPAPAHQGEGLDALVRQIRGREVTAVACANDRTASRLIERLAQEGLGVPAQVSVLGFDDSALFRYHRPALSTVRQEFEAIGYEAARALVKLLEGAAVGYKKILLPARLIQRESTGPRACIGGTHGDETGSIGGF